MILLKKNPKWLKAKLKLYNYMKIQINLDMKNYVKELKIFCK